MGSLSGRHASVVLSLLAHLRLARGGAGGGGGRGHGCDSVWWSRVRHLAAQCIGRDEK